MTRVTGPKISQLEELYALQVQGARLPAPVREFRFDPKRRWRVDFAWPERTLLVEIEGGTWVAGRHSRGSGFVNDCEKYNTAALKGYTVLRFTGDMVKSGAALEATELALGLDK